MTELEEEKTFKTDDCTVMLQKDPGCRIELVIRTSPKVTQDQYKKALKTINKEVSLPGFRKGKAPEDLIKKHYGNHLEREWHENVLHDGFIRAVKLIEIYPLKKDSVQKAKLENVSLDEGCVITVVFESHPDVPEIDVNSLDFETAIPEKVTDKEINQIIEDIRYQFAEWENIKDRPVQHGDFVDIDIKNIDGQGEYICEDTRLEVNEEVGKWLYDLLIGMNVGEEKSGRSSLDAGQKIPDFQPTNCLVTVKSIQQGKLPELNDELAKKVGIDNVDDLNKRIQEDLEKTSERTAWEKTRENLKMAIASTYTFDLPSSIVNPEVHRLVQLRTEQIHKMNEGKEGSIAEQLSEMEKETVKEVERSLRYQFIAQKIAKDENINIDKDEILQELVKKEYINPKTGAGSARKDEKPEDVIKTIHSSLIADKAADCLLEKIKKMRASE